MFEFIHPERIHWIWPLIALFLVVTGLKMRDKNSLDAFISPEMQKRLMIAMPKSRKYLASFFVFVALLSLVVASMRPYTQKVENIALSSASANIAVVIDVSKSMLAQDAAPNRLERAKAEIRDFLPTFNDDRLALIAFAGRASVLCPLTTDIGYFRNILESVNINSVSTGGTKIGSAIEKATQILKDNEGPKAILLITDGEDHDSYPLEAAKNAATFGIAVVAVGFGSEKGAPLSVTNPITKKIENIADKDGKTVISRLDGKTLRDIALETKGVYVPAGTGALDIEGILQKHVIPLVRAPKSSAEHVVKVEFFQIFVFIALLSLLAYAVTLNSKKLRRSLR